MAYLAFADLRLATAKWWASGATLTTAQIADADLTALIAAQSARFDRATGDHFEAEVAATVVCDGEDEPLLWVPKRIRAVTSVTVTYPGGAAISTPSTAYSFEAFTGDFSQISHGSYLSLVPGMYVWPGGWPGGRQNISIVGNFSWPTCPDEVKRAVALMCWEVVQDLGDYMRSADTVQVDGATVTTPGSDLLSRVVEVNRIAQQFCRPGRY